MAWGLIASWTIGVALLVAVAVPELMDMVQPVDDEVRELRAHWLTDVVAGVAFGTAAALTAVAVVNLSSRAR